MSLIRAQAHTGIKISDVGQKQAMGLESEVDVNVHGKSKPHGQIGPSDNVSGPNVYYAYGAKKPVEIRVDIVRDGELVQREATLLRSSSREDVLRSCSGLTCPRRQ